MRRGGGLLFWGEAGFERRLCGAVVAAVPRKRSGNRRCVSWSKGSGCGGAESLSFGERTGSNGCSAGRWLLPLPGNGPGAGGVLLCRREQAAAGRRASLSGRGRIRTRHPSPPLFASAIRLRCSLPPPAACHHPPPATTRRLPLPAARYLRHRCLPPLSLSASPLPVAFPRLLSPAACRPLPPPLSASPLLPAVPPLLTSRTRCLPPSSFPCLSSSAVACTPAATARRLPPSSFPCLSSSAVACTPAASHPSLPPAATVACHPRYSPQSATTRRLPFPPPCAGRADRWAAAAPRVVGRGAMRRRREVLRNNLENRKILPIFVSVKYRGSGLSRPGFLFFIGLSFLWQKRLSI